MNRPPGPVLVPLGPVGGGSVPGAPGSAPAPPPLRWALEGRELDLHVLDLGLACCAVELVAATRAAPAPAAPAAAAPAAPAPVIQVDPGRPGTPTHLDHEGEAGPTAPSVLVVAGTVTDALAPHVLATWRLLQPELVLSMGSCSNSGGPYWDSYSVTKGVDQLVPVDVYVPGCPPPPGALLDALRRLADAGATAAAAATAATAAAAATP